MLGPVDPYYVENPAAEMALRAGDVVLMDTRVMHCGGQNKSCVSSQGCLFYLGGGRGGRHYSHQMCRLDRTQLTWRLL